MRRASLLLGFFVAIGLASSAVAGDPAPIRRLLALLGGIEGEYAEAFDDAGAFVRPIERDEARMLLAEARDLQPHLDATAPADVGARLAAIDRAVAAEAPAATVRADVQGLRAAIVAATGVTEDLMPLGTPSPARGAAVFGEQCASCHGAHGTGDGPDAAHLARRPADFTDLGFIRQETPIDFFRVISLGRRQAAMPAWGDVLSVQQRWDAVAYLWSLATPADAVVAGERTFVAECASCHEVAVDARLDRLASRSDADLFAAVSAGVAGMPGFAPRLDEATRWNVVAFLRGMSLGRLGGAVDGLSAAAMAQALAAVRRGVDESVAAYRGGEDSAPALATDAYLRFEPLESQIAAHDGAAMRRVEETFLRLRAALRRPGATLEVDAAATGVRRALDAAESVTRDGGTGGPSNHARLLGLGLGGAVVAAAMSAFLLLRRKRPSPLLPVLLLFLPLAARAADAPDWPPAAEARYGEARSLMQGGHYGDAAAAYRAVADWPDGGAFPERAQALFLTALMQENAHDYEHALETYHDVARRFPGSQFAAKADAGAAALAEGGAEHGIAFKRQLDEAWGALFPAQDLLERDGLAAARPGLEQAATLLAALLRDYPDHPRLRDVAVSLGDAHMSLGLFHEARADYEKAIALIGAHAGDSDAELLAGIEHKRGEAIEATRQVWITGSAHLVLVAIFVALIALRPWRVSAAWMLRPGGAFLVATLLLAGAAMLLAKWIHDSVDDHSPIEATLAALLVLLPAVTGQVVAFGYTNALAGRPIARRPAWRTGLVGLVSVVAALAVVTCVVEASGIFAALGGEF